MKMTAANAAAILAFGSCTSAAYLPVNATQGLILAAEGARAEKLATKLTTPGTAAAGDLPAATLADKSKEPKINMAPISYSAEEVLFAQGKACTKWSVEEWAGDEKKGFPKRSAIPVCRHWEYDENRTAPYYVMRGAMMWNQECLKNWSVHVDGQYVAVKCGKHTASDPLDGVARVLFKELQGSELEVPVPNDPVVLDDTGDHLVTLPPLSPHDIIHQVQRRGRGGGENIMHDEPLPSAPRPSEVGLEDPGHHLPIWAVLPKGDNEHEGVQRRGLGGPGNRAPLLVADGLCSAEANADPAMMSKTLKTYCEVCVADPRPGAWQHIQDCRKLYDQVMEEKRLKWYSSHLEDSGDRPTRIAPVAPTGEVEHEGVHRRGVNEWDFDREFHETKPSVVKDDTDTATEDVTKGNRPETNFCRPLMDQSMSELRKEFCAACVDNQTMAGFVDARHQIRCAELKTAIMAEGEDLSLELDTPKPRPSTTSTPVMKTSIAGDAETCTFSGGDMSGARADFCSSGCKTSGKQGIRCEKLAVQVKAEDEHGIFLPAFDGMPKLKSIMRGNKSKCEKLCSRTADYPATAWDGWCRTRCNGMMHVD